MTRPLVPDDLYRLALAAEPVALAGGGAIACVATFDRERDAIVRRLRRFDATGAHDVSAGPDDRAPVLAPDGCRLAYVAAAERSSSQLRVVDLETSHAWDVGAACDAIADPAWSPDGRTLAFTALAARDAADATIFRDARSGALHVRSGPYKDDARGLLDGRTRALVVVDVAGGAVRVLVACGDDIAAPSWSPDGTAIAYARRDMRRRARMCGTIEVVDVASGRVRALTAGDGPAYAPSFAPDGRTIAFTGHRHGDDNRFGCEAFVVPAAGGEPRSLTRAFDRPVGNVLCGDLRSGTTPLVRWLPGGDELALLLTDGGACSLVAVDVRSGASRTLAGGARDVAGFALAPDGGIVVTYATPVEPSVIASLDADGVERVVATLNGWLADCTLRAPERFVVESDGAPVEAWVIAPASTGVRPPLVLDVHPGPHAAFGWTFVLAYQLVAASGIAVVYANPRGSLGYGEAFGLGTTGDWGGGDARDLLAVLDAAIARVDADPHRLACMGQSYGGFMATWLLAHTTRFATGISLDAVNDFASLFGASDVGWSMETELATDVAADAGRTLFERSALRGARAIGVPLLIVHGARDERCPIDQAEQLYTTLRYDGTNDVEFVRFAGGTHELSRSGNPRERVLRLRVIANWLTRRLGLSSATGSLFA